MHNESSVCSLTATQDRQPATNNRNADAVTAQGVRSIQIPRRFVAGEWGGTETTILQSSRALTANGHPARIFTSLALSKTRRETLHDVEVRRFPYSYPFLGPVVTTATKWTGKAATCCHCHCCGHCCANRVSTCCMRTAGFQPG